MLAKALYPPSSAPRFLDQRGRAAGVRFQCVVANQPRNRLYAESGALQLMQPGKTYAAVFGFVFDGPAVCSQGCCWAVMRASCEHTETAVAHILYSSSQPGLPLMWWRGKHSKASIDLAMERSSDFAVQQASAYRNGVHNDRIAARFWRADYVMRLCKKEEHPWHCNESAFSSWQKLTLRLAPAISKHPVWRESMPMARCEGCSRCRFAFWRMTSSFPNGSGSMPGSKRLAAIIGPRVSG